MYCKAVPARDTKYKATLFVAVLSRANTLISGYIVNNHRFLCFHSSLSAVGYLNVAVSYVISATQDGGEDNENKGRTLGPQSNTVSTLTDITHRCMLSSE